MKDPYIRQAATPPEQIIKPAPEAPKAQKPKRKRKLKWYEVPLFEIEQEPQIRYISEAEFNRQFWIIIGLIFGLPLAIIIVAWFMIVPLSLIPLIFL